MSKITSTLFIVGLTAVIFLVTKNPITAGFKLHMALISIVLLIIFVLFNRKKGQSLTSSKTFIYFFSATVLFLVGATGWFFSPFFFSLYLLTIILAFILSVGASLGFVGTLIAFFSFNVGDVDLTYDFLVILSLLTSIPISLYLRKEFLRIKEGSKDILILEKEEKEYENKITEVLANKMSNFAVSLREPINDMRLIAHRLDKVKNAKAMEEKRERIINASEQALRILREFEETSTGKKLMSTPTIDGIKNPLPSKQADQA